MTDTDGLRAILDANRAGAGRGIYAVCSANPLVLEACFRQALADDAPLLIEATSNQVNQDGGYTGRTPAGFRDEVHAIAAAVGFPPERIILGGDHLGPNPWQHAPATEAMPKAEAMVAAYAAAGFGKIHLDASMACAGDPVSLAAEVVAARAARLCAAAERAAPADRPPVYVIGTEVPIPGGAQEALDHLAVTRVVDLERTIAVHARAFAAAGLAAAWARVIAVVVQPGVEFGHAEIVDFAPEKAAALSAAIRHFPGLVYEAHSTDYQTEANLRALVQGHFAILKVGPGLTFALREAIFALDAIEAELLPAGERAGVRDALERAMLANPVHWQKYYPGSEAEQRLARAYSLSDRSRYYWPVPEVQAALDRLLANLAARPIPLPLVSQYLPTAFAAIRDGRLANEPRALIRHRVREVAAAYARACGLPGVLG
ncbi:D-tagatose-bisphosphate aldolase, class II, non-catalytic subunit [Benzoatithermus flavus]|uniref:D-tagatose-bisphosphate aldolase, class II, non-catalytic subunit n=1 Tax=Benzoatithermus flavus TaxID=3108223 RepID=A0ABU8XSF8_9PROT